MFTKLFSKNNFIHYVPPFKTKNMYFFFELIVFWIMEKKKLR